MGRTSKEGFPGISPRRRWSPTILGIGILLTLLQAVIAVLSPTFLRELECLGYDTMLRSLPPEESESGVVIVDVDEETLSEFGQWPWPRYMVADLLDRLHENQAASIGLDFLFAEPDRLSLGDVRRTVERRIKKPVLFGDVPDDMLDNDVVLARSLARENVVSALWFAFDEEDQHHGPCRPPCIAAVVARSKDAPEALPLPLATHGVCPTPILAQAARSTGFINSLPDVDGKIRRVPLLIAHQEHLYPSLALLVAMRAVDANQITAHASAAGIDSVRFNSTTIPTDRQGNMLLDFRGGGAPVRYISAARVLKADVDTDDIKGKAVFVGSSATGLKDAHPTPVNRDCPGVEIHARAAQSLLGRRFVRMPSWSVGARVVLVVFVGLLVAFLLGRFNLVFCALAGTGVLAALWYGSRWQLAVNGLFVSPTVPMVVLVLNFLLVALIRFRRDERRIFRGVRALATAQNCAILGLTSIAETRDPETGKHIVRTQHFVRLLADKLTDHPRFKKYLTPENVDMLFKSAPLHDVGKVGVPDEILLKPGKLTDDEFARMKQHTTMGEESLERAERAAGLTNESSFLRYAREIALTHHEKWDGTGYPKALKGDDIPVSGRLMALADVYDALTSRRCYKPPFPHDKAAAIIVEGRGTHFDPDIVDTFIGLEDEFQAVAAEYADTPDEAS